MIQITVNPTTAGVPATIRCLRRYTDLPVAELRARLADQRPVVDFPFEKGEAVIEVRRCRSVLRELDAIGADIRVWDAATGEEESREFLHNWMRTLIQISKETRDQSYREADADEQ